MGFIQCLCHTLNSNSLFLFLSVRLFSIQPRFWWKAELFLFFPSFLPSGTISTAAAAAAAENAKAVLAYFLTPSDCCWCWCCCLLADKYQDMHRPNGRLLPHQNKKCRRWHLSDSTITTKSATISAYSCVQLFVVVAVVVVVLCWRWWYTLKNGWPKVPAAKVCVCAKELVSFTVCAAVTVTLCQHLQTTTSRRACQVNQITCRLTVLTNQRANL